MHIIAVLESYSSSCLDNDDERLAVAVALLEVA